MSTMEASYDAPDPGSADVPIGPSYGDRARWFDRDRRERYLKLLANGVQPMRAAKACKVAYSTVKLHRAEDPFFAQAERDARMEAIEEVAEAMYMAGASGNVQAGIFILTNRLPDEWKDNKGTMVIQNAPDSLGEGGGGSGQPVPIEQLRAEIRQMAADIEARQLELVHPLAIEASSTEAPPPAVPDGRREQP
jgi:hypothetical protein